MLLPAASVAQDDPSYEVGALVEVEWSGTWYPATVLEVQAAAPGGPRYKIHYEGWGSAWDEVVPPARIRPRGGAPSTAADVAPAAESEPVFTERWAEPAHTTARDLAEPEPVEAPESMEPGLSGVWALWIPTGVSYHTDGTDVIQRITPGAGADALTIRPDGSYTWRQHTGRLREVRPWFAQEEQRYYEVSDGAETYLLRYEEADDAVNLFFTVGGHMARGQRSAP